MANDYSAVHPQFGALADTFDLLHDSYEGEKAIKARRELYLPSTSGQRALGMNSANQEGRKLYDAYLGRAHYPDTFKRTVDVLLGLVSREAAVINLPEILEPLRANATARGEGLQALYERTVFNLLKFGRYGLQLDVDTERNIPYLVGWSGRHIRNWNDTGQGTDQRRRLRFVILDESRPTLDEGGFTWTTREIYRVLERDPDSGRYQTYRVVEGNPDPPVQPVIQGQPFEGVPFVFVNARDLLSDLDRPPLEGLSRLCLAIYRGEADYRHALFMQGQDTLVVIGSLVQPGTDEADEDAEDEIIVGAGTVLNVAEGGDVKFVGVTGAGLTEMRQGLENDYEKAESYGARVLDSERGAESGEALYIRVGGRTASLATITRTAAKALEDALRMAATWVGADPDDVKVSPNLDFIADRMTGAEAVAWVEAKLRGAPLAWRSLHEIFQRRDVTKRTFEEEAEEAAAEQDAALGFTGADRGGEPDMTGAQDDEDEDEGEEEGA